MVECELPTRFASSLDERPALLRAPLRRCAMRLEYRFFCSSMGSGNCRYPVGYQYCKDFYRHLTSPTIRVWLTVSFLKQFAGECVWIISEINECGLATGPAAMSALENIMPREKISFPGFDGSKLSALLELPDKSSLGYVLFAHCFSCGKDLASA